MPFFAKIKAFAGDLTVYNAGCLYTESSFPFSNLIRKVLSRVIITDDHVKQMKSIALEGTVVYVLKNKSQLNSLIIQDLSFRKAIPEPVYCHGINMINWQPFPQAFKVVVTHLIHWIMRKKTIYANRMDYLSRLVLEGKTTIIHLGESELFRNPFVEETLDRLIETQRNTERPIYLCPQLITYGRRRERENENIINILFGQSDTTGPLRRLITFIRYSNRVSVIPAEQVNLVEYINTAGDLSREQLVYQLREDLIGFIEDEKETIVGPVLKPRDEMIEMILQDKSLISFMEEIAEKAKKGKTNFLSVRKTVKRYLYEIASDYNEIAVEIWEMVLTWLWNNIYDGLVVDADGIEKIRQVSKKMPFVIIPCHRSHFDYLLLSYIFYKNNIQLPFIAAGNNLAFFPMGYIFRKSGAFFLRRSFRGNDLYAEALSSYVQALLKEGLPLEFFIEGGRSRTGKMIMPKYGLLSMIIDVYRRKACEDLAVIPVYIGYDRVIEERAYLDELGGAPKGKEKASAMIRSGGLLRKRYGRVYMNVGEPILLKSYLSAQDKTIEDMTVLERQRLYRQIGYEVVREINEVSVVTPSSLIAAGLLCYDRRGISLGELQDVLELFYNCLSFCKAPFAMTFSDRDKALAEALNLFVQSGLIARLGAEEDEEEENIEEIVYSLEDDKRLNLEYYKNNILHFFLPFSFVAASILATTEDMIPLNRIHNDYIFFKRLFRHEFIFDDKKDSLEELKETLAYFCQQSLIDMFEKDDKYWIEVKGLGRTKLFPFAGLVQNYMESYWIAVRGCYYLRKKPKSEKDWLKTMHNLGERMFRKGEIRRAEALSQSNYQSAIRYLQDLNIVAVTKVQEKREKRLTNYFVLTEQKVQMELFRRRLFKFL